MRLTAKTLRSRSPFYAFICLTMLAAIATCRREPELPQLTPLQEEFRRLPTDLAPLFLLGDVNEDGSVDKADEALVARHVSSKEQNVAEASCLAAGDVSLDGRIDSTDLAALRRLVSDSGEIAGLPLYSQPYMACSHKNRLVAAPAEWRAGQTIRVRLLRGGRNGEAKLFMITGQGDVRALEDSSGWDVVLSELDADSLVAIQLTLGDRVFSYTMAGPETAAAYVERWVEAGRTDTNEFGDYLDPLSGPPPTIWGEEIDSILTCPQKGKGCEALVIDIAKKLNLVDSDRTKEALESIGCNMTYVAPEFVRIPQPYMVLDRRIHSSRWIEIRPSQQAIDSAEAKNRAAWLEVRAAIARHRANVRQGKEIVIQLVSAHGSNGPRYGEWSPGFSAQPGSLTRADFHRGNYLATKGQACHAIALDRSCYSGNTPKAVNRVNNTGRMNYFEAGPGIDHGYHAAFWSDQGAGTSPSGEVCSGEDVLVTDVRMAWMIQREGRNGNFQRLAALGFRDYIAQELPSKYADRGYNRLGSQQCQQNSHVRAY